MSNPIITPASSVTAPSLAKSEETSGEKLEGKLEATHIHGVHEAAADTEHLPTSESGEKASHETNGDKHSDDEAFVVKEPEYFTMPPKKPRPPQKTREERGLPPLPQDYEDKDAVPHFDDASEGAQSGKDAQGSVAMSQSSQDAESTEEPKQGMTLMGHLGELRTRLVRAFIAVGLCFVLCYSFAEQLFAELCKPLIAALPEGSKLIFTALPEAFFVYLQVGLVAAIFLASPFLFYQIWAFVAPGLYDEEKKYMLPMATISAIFFLSGASFCFFVVFPYAFTFFVGFASEDIAAMPSLSEYLGFSLKLLIAFGLIFEMPLFTFFLSRMGLVTATRMRSVRRYAVLCIFIVAAILTPPDVISQLLMAMPMMLLYELSIGVAVLFGRKKKAESAADDADDAEGAEKEEVHAEERKSV